MKKKSILILAGVLVVVIAAGVILYRHRGGDIIGVTTYSNQNTVIMNAKSGSDFVSGTGTIDVGEGRHVHIEHALTEGSVDVAFASDKNAVEQLRNIGVDNLPDPEAEVPEATATQEGISGKGSVDLALAPGSYLVTITNNDAVGKVTITEKAD